MLKLGVIVGHSEKDGGAVLNIIPIAAQQNFQKNVAQEYDYNLQIAQILKMRSRAYGFDVEIFDRNNKTIEEAHAAAEEWGAEVVLELHFNSSEDKSVKGAEILVLQKYDEKSLFEEELCQRMANLFQGPNRGVKHPDSRGLRNVNRPVPTYLLEPFFGSNQEQAVVALEAMVPYTTVIFVCLRKYFANIVQ